MSSPIVIRACRGLEELGACVRLQSEVWGLAESDVVPRRSFVVASRIGGQVIGAFETRAGAPAGDPPGEAREQGGERLIGFAMALPGFGPSAATARADGGPPVPSLYLHSHMLAVEAAYRNRGIGRRLKLFQREEALARGIRRMEWTFDPLEIKNAYLNISRLGVIVRRYSSNMYGVSSSRLQAMLPTDRLHAEWWMESRRVSHAIQDQPPASAPVEMEIVVPAEIGAWKTDAEKRERAVQAQRENRQQFEQAFDRGLAVRGFRVDPEGNGIFQLAPMAALEAELLP